VANLATRRGLQIDRLVLLSWPVHGEWFPDFANVQRIIDIRVRLDLVIIADRGARRSPHRRAGGQGDLARQRVVRARRYAPARVLGTVRPRGRALSRTLGFRGERRSIRQALAFGATWRLTGITAAGHALLDAVTAGGETERTLAGMLLVKAGDRSVPVVTEAVLAGRAPADLVDVLASINTADARAALVRVAQAPMPESRRQPGTRPRGRCERSTKSTARTATLLNCPRTGSPTGPAAPNARVPNAAVSIRRGDRPDQQRAAPGT